MSIKSGFSLSRTQPRHINLLDKYLQSAIIAQIKYAFYADNSHVSIQAIYKDKTRMFDLHLHHYRGFKNQTLKFGKINILIGENSGGKSSIFKFLLALKQGFESKRNNLTLFGNETDLGTYKDIIANHSITKRLNFGFTTDKDYSAFFARTFSEDSRLLAMPRFRLPLRPPSRTTSGKSNAINKHREQFDRMVRKNERTFKHFLGTPVTAHYSLTRNLTSHGEISTHFTNDVLGELSISFSDTTLDLEDSGLGKIPDSCELHYNSRVRDQWIVLENIKFYKDSFLTMVDSDSLKGAIDAAGLSAEKKLFGEIAYFLLAQNYLQEELKTLEYVNPILSQPAERIYVTRDQRVIGNLSDITTIVNFFTPPSRKKLLVQLSETLQKFGIVDELYLKKQDYTTELRVKLNGVDSNIKDVGYGVSLQIPIFAQALFGSRLPTGQILLIEQPEIHLHPKLQAKFLEALLELTGDQPIFIETHSEHIVRMLQLMVKEQRNGLTADDVSIYFFEKKNQRQVATRHAINPSNGRLEPPFPRGFYDVSYDLAMNLLK